MLRYSDNIRGEEVFNRDPVIFNGKGELFFKKIDGRWHESILSVDRCFGVMKSKWRPLNI